MVVGFRVVASGVFVEVVIRWVVLNGVSVRIFEENSNGLVDLVKDTVCSFVVGCVVEAVRDVKVYHLFNGIRVVALVVIGTVGLIVVVEAKVLEVLASIIGLLVVVVELGLSVVVVRSLYVEVTIFHGATVVVVVL